ncbi:uncharacterized protein F4812DRAFT_444649 [Daldinia caldariorum]|uniref:uncharacterized protein n=1 Tax=Daldinia caldariorum TaxID=326644 RepID=UPI002008DF09|nr:uncharacterized protein F4812DRAFT_444649 [Daldinia caldariorum]KAI1464110.1 hypothetical protein F4812DRAFT_444649 [Daldinia caldariorum]
MIRHPLHSAAGRIATRPDLNRVADGIAASLRQFSVSARRNAQDGNGYDDDDDASRRPTGRQRSAAAVNELMATVNSSINAAAAGAGPSRQNSVSAPSPARPQGPNIIRISNLPRGLDGIRRTASSPSGPPQPPQFNAIGTGPRIIRGGFVGRGRGGGSFPSRGGPPRQGGARGRGGGGLGFRGRGPQGPVGLTNVDNRPRRGRGGGMRRRRGGGDDDEEGGGRMSRRRQQREREQAEQADTTHDLRVKAYFEEKDTGRTMVFNPQLTLETLAGWGPAVATASTPFGQGETVLRQARILGSGQAYHPQNLGNPHAMIEAWQSGAGCFVPPSDDGRLWKKQVFRARPFEAPAEVKTAILEDALLGKYGEGPKYADPKDTIGTLRSYVRRDGTWNAQAERRIEDKVRRILGLGPAAGAASDASAAAAAKSGAKA